ncbi:MAG TPA: NAD-dependent epimerase/dehydratase family protein, partial [Planctomycetes bacterium]|nr:NAD-dependent epimerase/dehydratase family protein [Planctomycetota bacterium]
KKADAVVNLAALCNPALYNTRPLDVIDINFTHVLPLVRSCSKHRRMLVHFSTCEVYGKTIAGFAPQGSEFAEDARNYLLSEDASPLVLGPVQRQRWTYSCAKQLLERVIYAEGFEHGLPYSIVRPFNVIGPRMDFLPGVDGEGIPRVVPSFMKALLSGEPLKLVDGGMSRRSFIHVRDALDAVERILDRPDVSSGEIFNVGNPANETTIRGLATMMMAMFTEKTGSPPECGAVDVMAQEYYGAGYDDCDRRVPDVSKAERLLGWRPTVSLSRTVSDTMDWYIREYGKRPG